MRIGELAELAGVTVRTIRYYHQAGALPEPPRLSNGYRDYTVDHLVALLRISQLTGSGLSLAQAGAMVADTPTASTDEALDEVDRALEAQITELTARRERLAQARAGQHVGLSKVAAALTLSPADVPSAMLFAHLYREHPQIDEFAEALTEPAQRAAIAALQERFEKVDASTPDSELAALWAEAEALMGGIGDDLPALTEPQLQLVFDLLEQTLNERQLEFLRQEVERAR